MSYLKDLQQKKSLDELENRTKEIIVNPYEFEYQNNILAENIDEFNKYVKLYEHEKLIKDIFSSLKSEDMVDKRILIGDALFKRYSDAIEDYASVHCCLAGFNQSVAELVIAFVIEQNLKDELSVYIDKRKHILNCAMSGVIENLSEYMDIFAWESSTQLFNNYECRLKPTLYNKVEAAFNDHRDYAYTESSSYVGETPFWDVIKLDLDYIISMGESAKELMQHQRENWLSQEATKNNNNEGSRAE